MKKIYVDIVVSTIIVADDGTKVDDIMDNIDVAMNLEMTGASVIENEIKSYEITDVK